MNEEAIVHLTIETSGGINEFFVHVCPGEADDLMFVWSSFPLRDQRETAYEVVDQAYRDGVCHITDEGAWFKANKLQPE